MSCQRTASLGSLGQLGSGLRAGFAVFLRKNRRVTVFLAGTCPSKKDFRGKSPALPGVF